MLCPREVMTASLGVANVGAQPNADVCARMVSHNVRMIWLELLA